MMLNRANMLTWAGLALVAIAAALASVWLAVHTIGAPPKKLDIHGTYLDGGRPIANFDLTDHRQENFTPEQLKGSWSLLTFGYINCPDTTPEMLEMLSLTYQILDGADLTDDLQVAMVSVATEHDTPPRLANFAPRFHKEFIALTGSYRQINKLTSSLGIRVTQTNADKPSYSIRPEGTIVLINPEGKLLALFTPPHHPQLLAEDLYNIIQHERENDWLNPIVDR